MKTIFLVAAIILFVLVAILSWDNANALNTMALESLGLASFAASFLFPTNQLPA